MQIGLPKPDKQYKWDKWRAYIYKKTQTAILIRQDGKAFIIKPSTQEIRNIPRYVMRRLYHIGFLKDWERQQLKQSVTNLRALVNMHEAFVNERKRTEASKCVP